MSKQPRRQPRDGEIGINRDGGDIIIWCEQDGRRTQVRLGMFNAWRAFAMLAVLIGVRLPDSIGRKIKL